MALKKRHLLAGVVAVLAFSSLARAQTYQPFIEPGYFDYDMQAFSRPDIFDDYGGDPLQRYGWFASYDRMYLSVSRPVASQANLTTPLVSSPIFYLPPDAAADTLPTMFFFGQLVTVPGGQVDLISPQYNSITDATFDLGDKTWGNRVDIGYMGEENNGWLFSYMHIDGPNAGSSTRQQRLNRINEDDAGYVPPTTDDDDDGGDIVNPPSDRNTSGPPDRERFYDITNTLNQCKLNSVELNKTFRMAPLNHGGIIEPFIGVRYMKFQDYTTRQVYGSTSAQYTTDLPPTTIDTGGTTVIGPGGELIFVPNEPIVIPAPPGQVGAEQLVSANYQFDNDMIGGQLGLRWYRQLSRWNLSTDLRGFACENFQHLNLTYDREYTFYDGTTQGSQVTEVQRRRASFDDQATQTVLGTDIRVAAAYAVTRDVHLDVGLQFLGFFKGIGRGSSIAHNNADVMMTGVAFGVVWNR